MNRPAPIARSHVNGVVAGGLQHPLQVRFGDLGTKLHCVTGLGRSRLRLVNARPRLSPEGLENAVNCVLDLDSGGILKLRAHGTSPKVVVTPTE